MMQEVRGGQASHVRRAVSDRLLGPGASRADVLLALGSAIAAAVVLPVLAWWRGAEWSAAQWIVGALLAGDLVGGVVVNASTPARRYYFRPGRTRGHHLGFVALHLVHVLAFALLFRAGDWGFAVATPAGLLLAAALIRSAPVQLRRQVAMLCLVVGLIGSSSDASVPGMEWFVPVLFLKLLVCYLLGDVPAAPRPGSAAVADADDPAPPSRTPGHLL